MLQHIQDRGVQYKEAGQVKDPLLIFKNHGCNYVRLRLFLSPNGKEGQVNTLSYTLRLAKRVKQAGLKFMLDLHYSDGWADPSHQTMPAEWKGLSHQQLVERVFAYTRETLAAFQREGVMPDMVEVGNEITNWMMWPDAGSISDTAKWNDSANPAPSADARWDHLADLLKSRIRGVRESDPSGAVTVMIHIDKGGSRAVRSGDELRLSPGRRPRRTRCGSGIRPSGSWPCWTRQPSTASPRSGRRMLLA